MCYPDPEVANLEQDKIAQALEIVKLKQRVRKLEKKRRTKHSGLKRLKKGKIAELDADEDVTLADIDADTQERMEEDVTAVKDINVAEPQPIVFDDEQMQEKHLDNVKKYQSLKRKPISISQARKNMIVYLKNMVGYKIQHFKGMTYDQGKMEEDVTNIKDINAAELEPIVFDDEEVRPIFEREYKHVQTFLKSDRDEEPSKKRVAKETLLQESFKKLGAEVEVSGSRTYWRMIRVGGNTQAFKSFEYMLKDFDRDDLDALWRITKEKFSTAMPTRDKEKALWAELTRLYEPNADDGFPWSIKGTLPQSLSQRTHIGGIAELDANEDVTLVDVDADTQGRIEEDATAVKDINAVEPEPTVFDDEEVTMTMAQTLIKIKAEKQRILDKQMAKRMQDEEIEQAAAKERQEKEDLERAKVRPIFEKEYKHVQTFLKSDRDEEPLKKRVAKKTLLQESFKKLRAKVKVLCSYTTEEETPTVDPAEISQEDIQNMLQIVQWLSSKLKPYKSIGGITQEFQSFKDMLKDFDRDYLDALRRITKEKFNITMPTRDKEKDLWAQLTRLYKPNAYDGRMEEDVTAVMDINAAEPEPTVFNDEEVPLIFEKEYKHFQTFLKSDRDEEPLKKRVAKKTLLQESFKKLRAKVKVLGSYSTEEETPTIDPAKISQEDIQNMLRIIPIAEFKVEALQVKYPLIDWEIYSE
uniref:Uncharacterized protein n=1 Tax=Tanacetum cinerariifolium TaxID=118510 RepID=A0A699GQH6_TANCI|nr:hypothetical protein [Tanacetum cinerariifolium]